MSFGMIVGFAATIVTGTLTGGAVALHHIHETLCHTTGAQSDAQNKTGD